MSTRPLLDLRQTNLDLAVSYGLTSIFHPHKSIPVVTAARLQRCALFLAGYHYQIEYKNTKVHSNADGLSWLPLKTEERAGEVVDPVNVFNMMQFEPLPITVDNV